MIPRSMHFSGSPWWWDSLVEEAVAQEAERRRTKEGAVQGVAPKDVSSVVYFCLGGFTSSLHHLPVMSAHCEVIKGSIHSLEPSGADLWTRYQPQSRPEVCFTNYSGIFQSAQFDNRNDAFYVSHKKNMTKWTTCSPRTLYLRDCDSHWQTSLGSICSTSSALPEVTSAMLSCFILWRAVKKNRMTLWSSNPALGTHLPEIRTPGCRGICGRILTEALFVAKGREKGKVRGCRTTTPRGSLQPLILSQNNRETWEASVTFFRMRRWSKKAVY